MSKITTRQSGSQAEDIAASFLQKQKINIVTRNFYSRFGEIDLIAIEEKTLVFIEVRYRKNEHYLSAIETIDQRKCNKIITTSEFYVQQSKQYADYHYRFDVITITGDMNKPEIKWIKNAFA